MRALLRVGFVARLALGACVVACGSSVPEPGKPGEPFANRENRCVATTSRRKPASGWTQVGTVVVVIEDERSKALELRDATGKIIETKAMPKGDAKKSIAMVEEGACKLGGVLAALEGDFALERGTATFAVLKPNVEDEKADLAALCTMPSLMHEAFEPAQEVRLALDLYEERLTSRKWRAWLRALSDENVDARAKADELSAAARKRHRASDCWFAKALRKANP